MTISLEQAQTIAAAALAHGTEQGFNPLTVAVLDPALQTSRLLLARLDHLVDIARIMGEPQPLGQRRGGNVVSRWTDDAVLDEDFRKAAELRHGKAMLGIEIRVEGGMMDDRNAHGPP